MSGDENLIEVLTKQTTENKITWEYKSPKVLSDFVPDGNKVMKVYSTKFKKNNVYIAVRKYVETHRDPSGEYKVDVKKITLYVFDGVELLYYIEKHNNFADNPIDYLIREINSLIEKDHVAKIIN